MAGDQGSEPPLKDAAALMATSSGRDSGILAVVVPLLVCVTVVAMVVTAFGYNPEARRLPILVGVPLAVMAAVETGLRLRRTRGDHGATVSELGTAGRQRMRAALASLAAFVLLLAIGGQILGAWLFTVGFVLVRGELSRRGALILATAVAGLLWVVASVLEVRVYTGIFDLPLG